MLHKISHKITIGALPRQVYQSITERTELSSWWTRDVDVDESRNIMTFRFESGAFNRMEIVDIEKNKRVEWKCVDGAAEWIGTSVTFYLTPTNENETELEFTHGNWRESTAYMKECGSHWLHYLGSLKIYCETGEGTPNKGSNTGMGRTS